MSLLLKDVEVDRRRVDVRIDGGHVTEVSKRLRARPEDEVVPGSGGALLPGLHDHHLHLLAMAAARSSVDCSHAADRSALGAMLRASSTSWVRAVGCGDEDLDRHALDQLVPDRPVRVQHRSGALWVLNSKALALVAPALDHSSDVERDPDGAPNGRLWRYDTRLRSALLEDPPDLSGVGRELLRLGVTSVTDATPDLDDAAVTLLSGAQHDGSLPQTALLLGAADPGALPAGLRAGPIKLLLRDHDLPSEAELRHRIADLHAAGRPVAVHCVTAESLTLTLAVLESVGALAGDRVEHAAVVPPGVAAWAARLDVAVVTQPDFLRTRGDAYARDVDGHDHPWLYPYRSLLDCGLRVAASSDAPFGDVDPWQVVRSASDRRSRTGRVLGPDERVAAEVALGSYLTRADDPGGQIRRIQPGDPADLCLLHAPYDEAIRRPTAELVRMTLASERGSWSSD